MIVQNSLGQLQAAPPEARAHTDAPRPAAQLPPTAQASPEPSPQELQKAVESVKQVVASNSNLEFSIDPNTERVVVRMVDSATGDVIRQIPAKEILAIAESITQYQKGLLLSQSA
jgi:flagellar protein FlaG